MTYTVWSNGGRHEYIARVDGQIVARSGMIYSSRKQAIAALMRDPAVVAFQKA
jgi:hypothetical protein